MYHDDMPYKNPEDRRAKARENAARRRAADQERYRDDPEYRARLKSKNRAYYEANRERIKESVREYRQKNPNMQWAANIRRYGLSVEGWHELLIAQSGRCAICHDPMRDPHVDHDHSTSEVRGLLCTNCNTGLGKFRDDPDRLRAAIAYLS